MPSCKHRATATQGPHICEPLSDLSLTTLAQPSPAQPGPAQPAQPPLTRRSRPDMRPPEAPPPKKPPPPPPPRGVTT